MSIHHITLRAIAQATESEEKVKEALSLFLFDDEIEIIRTEGHFGNTISILQANLKGKNCKRFIDFIKSKLNEEDLKRLKAEIGERIDDKCYLHIRFDKQAAYNKVVRMGSKDSIAADIKLKVYPAKRQNAIMVAEKLF